MCLTDTKRNEDVIVMGFVRAGKRVEGRDHEEGGKISNSLSELIIGSENGN
jgi:hypothetical protein